MVGLAASLISPFYSILLVRNLGPLLYSSNCKSIYSGTYSEGAKPPWTSEIYWFQGVFRPQRVLSPPPQKNFKKFKPPPRTNSWIRPWIYYIKNRGGTMSLYGSRVFQRWMLMFTKKKKKYYIVVFLFLSDVSVKMKWEEHCLIHDFHVHSL